MPAVVRVKRRIDEEPLGAFVLNGKKRRLDDATEAATAGGDGALAGVSSQLGAAGKDEISTILKFAGTMQSQDDNAISQLARLTKDEAKQLVQQKSRKPTNLTERARQEMRQSLHENRFRVVNCLRTTLDAEAAIDGDTANETSGVSKEITIVDIEKHTAVATPELDNESMTESTTAAANDNTVGTALAQPSDSDTGYVYDLYLPENEQQAEYVDLMDDNYLSVRAFDDLVYEDRFNNDDDDEYDSEDSNQENHMGNDYPDEDDDQQLYGDHEDDDDNDTDHAETAGARDLRRAVEKFVFGEDDDEDDDEGNPEFYDQSSDDEDCVQYSDPYVHAIDVEEDGFAEDVDYCDVNRYGMAYARYKARVLKRLQGDAGMGDDDDDATSEKEEDSADERYHSASENEAFYD